MLKEDITLIKRADHLGLVLNSLKSEIICSTSNISDLLLPELPGARIVNPSSACLLGSPIGVVDSVLTWSSRTRFLLCS